MNDIDLIMDRLRENEEISRKFHEVEMRILSILDFTDLFEVLLTEIMDKFAIPFVWLSVIQRSEAMEMISALSSSRVLKERLNVVDRTAFFHLLDGSAGPTLVNDDMRPWFRLMPKSQKYVVRSLAVVPLTIDGDIIGSLNMADTSPTRFMPGMDTSLLGQLAVKVSICLSNVVAHEKLRFMAFHDPLTGLLNRRVMETILKRECARARRYETPLSVVFLDMDRFKSVNDTYGHDLGDEALKHVADRLTELVRESDVVARFAGDEFVILLPQTTAKQADAQMRRICAHFARTPLCRGAVTVPVSLSFGIASTQETDMEDPAALLKKADEMLYRAKAARKTAADGEPAKTCNVIPLPGNNVTTP